ncbi:MAG: chemotaxis protein CheW [Burkholderiales bacterium]|nr:chemotaxis protein CheW [Burkholderiales bacterium]
MDWNEVHRRIEASILPERSEEEVGRILRKRAQKIAFRKDEKEAAAIECLVFSLASVRFAVGMAHVREVFRTDAITPLPCTPDFVLGIANVRGEIISVLDIRRLVGMPSDEEDHARLVVFDAGDLGFGLAADGILGAREILLEAIHPSDHDNCLQGIAGGIMVIDAVRLMNDAGIIVKEEVDF